MIRSAAIPSGDCSSSISASSPCPHSSTTWWASAEHSSSHTCLIAAMASDLPPRGPGDAIVIFVRRLVSRSVMRSEHPCSSSMIRPQSRFATTFCVCLYLSYFLGGTMSASTRTALADGRYRTSGGEQIAPYRMMVSRKSTVACAFRYPTATAGLEL